MVGLPEFIHQVVVHRRDEGIRGLEGMAAGRIRLFTPHKWLRPDLVPLAPFLQCEPHLTTGGSGVLADPARIDEEFRKAWLPQFFRSRQRKASLDEFAQEDGAFRGFVAFVDWEDAARCRSS